MTTQTEIDDALLWKELEAFHDKFDYIWFSGGHFEPKNRSDGSFDKNPKGLPQHGKINRSNHKCYHKDHSVIAVKTGKESGITVLDFDDEDEFWNEFCDKFPNYQNFFTVASASKGYHVYFKYFDVPTSHADKFDLLNDGAIVFAHGSFFDFNDKRWTHSAMVTSEKMTTITECPPDVLEWVKERISKKRQIDVVEATVKQPVVIQPIQESESEQQQKFNLMRKLIPLYSIERRSNYNTWLQMMFLLVKNFGYAGLELFDEFSRPASNYNKDQNRIKYETQCQQVQKIKKSFYLDLAKCWARKDAENDDGDEKLNAYFDLFPAEVGTSNLMGSTDQECAQICYELLKDKFVYSNKRLWHKKNYLWQKDAERILRDAIFNSGIKIYNEEGMFSWVQCKELGPKFTSILDKFATNENKKFNEELHESTINWICYLNGAWNFKEKKFYIWGSKETASIKTCVMLDRNFNPNRNEEKISEVYQDLFLNPLGENYAKSLTKIIARALSGAKDKLFANWTGPRNAGKGFLETALKLAFESYVMTGQNAENFAITDSKSRDKAYDYKWLADDEFVRFCTMSEISDTCILDGTICKSCSSGIDRKDVRIAYGHIINIRFETFFMFLNNFLPPIKPINAKTNMFDIQTENFFLEPHRYNYYSELFDNGATNVVVVENDSKSFTKEQFMNWARFAKTNLKYEMKNIDYVEAFEKIILNAYEDSIVESNVSIPIGIANEKQEKVYAKILEKYTITNDDDDIILQDDLKRFECKDFKLINIKAVLEAQGVKSFQYRKRDPEKFRDKKVLQGIRLQN